MKLLIDAIFINNSGGKVLLDFLIKETHKKGIDFDYLLDERIKGSYPFLPENKVTYLSNSLFQRHSFYKKHQYTLEKVLCFGNVPPTIRLKAQVYTYFHNSVLFYTGNEFPLKTALGYKLKSLTIRFLKGNTDKWLVQTEVMRAGLKRYWGINSNAVELFPFYTNVNENRKESSTRDLSTYYFISDGHPNKMHHNLIPAFCKVSEQFPGISLYLTISDNYPNLIQQVEKANYQGTAIHNLGWCDQEELTKIYKNGGFLIFPSNTESFGLGLIEAAQYGMPVLASDLPFVHEVIRPSATFDPYSIDSIAAAIKKSRTEILPETQLCIGNRVHQLIQLLAE